jgi:hypothetical protein
MGLWFLVCGCFWFLVSCQPAESAAAEKVGSSASLHYKSAFVKGMNGKERREAQRVAKFKDCIALRFPGAFAPFAFNYAIRNNKE